MLGELDRIGRLHLGHRLRDDLERMVVAPRLVLGRLAVFLGELLDVGLRGRRIDEVVPHQRPHAREVALAETPCDRGVEGEANDRELQPVFGILLEEVGDLVAGEVRDHDVGPRLADLQEERREVRDVGRDQFVGGELSAVLLHEQLGDLQEVMAERIVGRQRVPLLSLDQILFQEMRADRLHVHRVRGLDVEHVLIAVRAAQRIRITAGVDEHRLGALRDLTDCKSRGRGNLADDHRDLVALDQTLGLRGCGLRIDRVLQHQFELAAVHAARRIDLVGGKLDAHHGVVAERAEEAGARRQVSDLDDVRLRARDRRHADAGEQRGAGGAFDQRTARER